MRRFTTPSVSLMYTHSSFLVILSICYLCSPHALSICPSSYIGSSTYAVYKCEFISEKSNRRFHSSHLVSHGSLTASQHVKQKQLNAMNLSFTILFPCGLSGSLMWKCPPNLWTCTRSPEQQLNSFSRRYFNFHKISFSVWQTGKRFCDRTEGTEPKVICGTKSCSPCDSMSFFYF